MRWTENIFQSDVWGKVLVHLFFVYMVHVYVVSIAISVIWGYDLL